MSIIFTQKPLSSLNNRGKINLMRLPPKLKIIIIPALIVALFIVLNLTGFSKEIKNFFYLISSPIQKTFWRAGDNASDFFEAISQSKNLKKENEELELKIQAFLAENIALKDLKKENEILREALGIGLEKNFKLVISQIIGKDISSDTILVNKGLNDGLTPGLPVITSQKILVGKISEVYKNFSKVMIISNKESSFDAEIENREAIGIAKGKGGLKLYLDFIPKEKEILEGDIVVTSALGGIFPKGLLVGQIKDIKRSDIEPFQQAEISPFFNIKELETLFILINW